MAWLQSHYSYSQALAIKAFAFLVKDSDVFMQVIYGLGNLPDALVEGVRASTLLSNTLL